MAVISDSDNSSIVDRALFRGRRTTRSMSRDVSIVSSVPTQTANVATQRRCSRSVTPSVASSDGMLLNEYVIMQYYSLQI